MYFQSEVGEKDDNLRRKLLINSTKPVEDFIELVKNVPAVWNMNSPAYADKISRQRAWDAVCSGAFVGFDDETEATKQHIRTEVRRKWKSLRDAYQKQLNHLSRAPSNKKMIFRKSPYVHFDALNFLREGKLYAPRLPKPLSFKSESSEMSAQEDSSNQTEEINVENGKCSKKQKLSSVAKRKVPSGCRETERDSSDPELPSDDDLDELSFEPLVQIYMAEGDKDRKSFEINTKLSNDNASDSSSREKVSACERLPNPSSRGIPNSVPRLRTKRVPGRNGTGCNEMFHDGTTQVPSSSSRLCAPSGISNLSQLGAMDDDRLFLLSLAPELRAVPDAYKLQVKTEMLCLFMKYRALSGSLPNQSNPIANASFVNLQNFSSCLPFLNAASVPTTSASPDQ